MSRETMGVAALPIPAVVTIIIQREPHQHPPCMSRICHGHSSCCCQRARTGAKAGARRWHHHRKSHLLWTACYTHTFQLQRWSPPYNIHRAVSHHLECPRRRTSAALRNALCCRSWYRRATLRWTHRLLRARRVRLGATAPGAVAGLQIRCHPPLQRRDRWPAELRTPLRVRVQPSLGHRIACRRRLHLTSLPCTVHF